MASLCKIILKRSLLFVLIIIYAFGYASRRSVVNINIEKQLLSDVQKVCFIDSSNYNDIVKCEEAIGTNYSFTVLYHKAWILLKLKDSKEIISQEINTSSETTTIKIFKDKGKINFEVSEYSKFRIFAPKILLIMLLLLIIKIPIALLIMRVPSKTKFIAYWGSLNIFYVLLIIVLISLTNIFDDGMQSSLFIILFIDLLYLTLIYQKTVSLARIVSAVFLSNLFFDTIGIIILFILLQ